MRFLPFHFSPFCFLVGRAGTLGKPSLQMTSTLCFLDLPAPEMDHAAYHQFSALHLSQLPPPFPFLSCLCSHSSVLCFSQPPFFSPARRQAGPFQAEQPGPWSARVLLRQAPLFQCCLRHLALRLCCLLCSPPPHKHTPAHPLCTTQTCLPAPLLLNLLVLLFPQFA